MNKKPIVGVILAGGKGKRLNCTDQPKVLIDIAGKPMLRYVFDAVKKVVDEIIIITGFCGDRIKKEMAKEDVEFAHQAQQLGTAHALAQAEKFLKGKDCYVLVVNGDGPLFRAQTFQKLIDKMESDGYVLVFSSVVENEHPAYGRVIRDEKNKVVDIVELKDASEEEQKVQEKNVGIYLVDNTWLWPAIKKINKSSASGEYYITDLVKIALKEGKNIEAVQAEDKTVIKGINTPEELKEVEKIILNSSSSS